MKKTNQTHRTLKLSRETVASLDNHQLANVAGGAVPETKLHSCLTNCASTPTSC